MRNMLWQRQVENHAAKFTATASDPALHSPPATVMLEAFVGLDFELPLEVSAGAVGSDPSAPEEGLPVVKALPGLSPSPACSASLPSRPSPPSSLCPALGAMADSVPARDHCVTISWPHSPAP